MSKDFLGRIRDGLREHEGRRSDVQQGPTMLVQETARGRVWSVPAGSERFVGRHEQADIVLQGERMSRKHARLHFDGQHLRVENLSPRGTQLNDAPLDNAERSLAEPGDTLRFGRERELRVVGVLDPQAERREAGLLTLPQRIGSGLILLREVGRGAAGIVYEAWDEARARRCAIKVLLAGGWAHPELIERFRREAMLQGQLGEYPGIVSVYEHGSLPDTGELFAVMEFVPGKTLRRRLRKLSLIDGVRVLARVSRSAHFAHERGLVHRDLKPENVMLHGGPGGEVRLTDFGIAKALEGDDGLTATGVMLGTPSYMAPEQLQDSKRVGPPADVYALGAILYELLTRKLPFGKLTPGKVGELLDQILQGTFAAPNSLDPQVPLDLNALCLRCMSRDPGARPAALTLAKDLEAWARRVDPPSRVSLLPPDTKG